MKLKKGKAIAAAACAVALAGTIGIAASFTSQGSAEATVRTGVVGIELAEVAPQPDRLLVTGSLVETDTSRHQHGRGRLDPLPRRLLR